MKRLACFAVALGLAAFGPATRLRAQEPVAEKAKTAEVAHEGGGHEEKEPAEIWKWANFVILAGGLGYLIGKNAPAFFAARSKKIVQDMTDAQTLRAEAEARAAEVDKRLANLERDIDALQVESQSEVAAETERMGQHTAAEIAKIEAHARQEIESAGKVARMELRRFAAQLAIRLAEQKIQTQITPEAQDNLVRGFVEELRTPPSGAQRN